MQSRAVVPVDGVAACRRRAGKECESVRGVARGVQGLNLPIERWPRPLSFLRWGAGGKRG